MKKYDSFYICLLKWIVIMWLPRYMCCMISQLFFCFFFIYKIIKCTYFVCYVWKDALKFMPNSLCCLIPLSLFLFLSPYLIMNSIMHKSNKYLFPVFPTYTQLKKKLTHRCRSAFRKNNFSLIYCFL